MVHFDSGRPDADDCGLSGPQGREEAGIERAAELEPIEELKGRLARQDEEDKLMHSVLENDSQTLEQAKLIMDSFDRGIGSFTPDIIFRNIVRNYRLAKRLYGERFLRAVSGHDPRYIEDNIPVPEFRRELQERIRQSADGMRREGLLDREYVVEEKGTRLAALMLYAEELDDLVGKGHFGEKISRMVSRAGEREEERAFRKGDRYRAIALRKTIKRAVRRSRPKVRPEDLMAYDHAAHGKASIVYAIDASASMKGDKIRMAKKAGIALSFNAIEHRDQVGLLVFGSEVIEAIGPCDDFPLLLHRIVSVRPGAQTNLQGSIRRAVSLFPAGEGTKHVVLLTDALPNVGEVPEKETLDAAAAAAAAGITLSVIGLSLDEAGERLARRIVGIGQGRLYAATDLTGLDTIILEDYDRTVAG
ncbi:VWA domain-containing protein [Candidatus Woesearchaeota archaeon]|nr:VWA domain-containing protein [Candidatus Woesearchaeota archaeon]